MRDITERKQAEEALRESEERYRMLFEHSPYCIHEINKDGRLISMNHAGLQMSGLNELRQVLDRPYLNFVRRNDREWIGRLINLALNGEASEFEFVGPNGRMYHSTFVPISNPGGMVDRIMGITQDITDRKAAEETLQTSERAIRKLYEITSSPETSFESRVRGLLELGCRRFDLPIGAISQQVGDHMKLAFVHDEREGENRFVEQSMKPFYQTYCAAALLDDEPVCFEHAEESSEWHAQRGYSNLGLEAFLGAKLVVGQEIYGTICFMSPLPYPRPFTEGDKDFLMLMSHWFEREIERQEAEEELKRQRSFLRQIIDINPNFVFAKNREGRFTLANQAVADVYGTTVDDILGKTEANFNPNLEEVEFFRQMDLEVMDSRQERFMAEEVVTDKTGKRHWMQTVKRPLLNKDGFADHILGFATDITARKQAEEALKKNEERFRAVVETAHDAIITADGQGAIVAWNYGAQVMFGHSGEEIIGQSLTLLMPERYRKDHQRGLQRVASGGVGKYIGTTMELAGLRKNGSEFPLELSLTTWGSGQERFFTAIIRDISARKQAEADLKASEERYTMVMDAVNDGIWDWEVATETMYFSPMWKKQLGYEDDELQNVYEEWESRIHPDDQQRVMASLKDHVEMNRPYECEYRLQHKDGSYVWILTRGACLRDEHGHPVRMIGSHSDVTRHKLAEEKVYQTELQLRNSQKFNALGTLAGGIAHDFNNILSAILGYTELSLSQALHDETLRKYLAEVTQAGMRAKDLVGQILTFSRHGETQKKPLNLQKVIEEVLLLIRATLPTTITIQQRLSGESDLIQGDATQIHQVLMNLCTNAGYAMRDQGGILTVQLEAVEGNQDDKLAHFHDLPAGTYLLLTVKDTGHGIDADILDKIFDPFFTTKKTGKGTGMGLAVVHGIIADHQGHIRVQSMQGKGTIVSIVFPIIGGAHANMEINRESERPSSAPCKPESQGHVLFVDDEAPLVALGKELLENFGYQVTPFTNSVDALKAFRATPDCFDILITDQTMPNLTGEALAREVLKIRSDFPILLCTGFSYTMTAEKAQKVGIRKFMMKPLLPSELVLAIQEVLRVVCSKD